jgi:hypothetical protein
LVEQLANALKGAVGATRPAVDEGWADMDQMIGHSGKSVGPKLYIGVGVSGDMLHMIGVAKAQVIVAINSDPQAPVFQQADYGIVGDYRAVLPILSKKLRTTGYDCVSLFQLRAVCCDLSPNGSVKAQSLTGTRRTKLVPRGVRFLARWRKGLVP